MSARMFPLFFVISLAVLCFAGEVNAESPALTSLSNLGDARTPLTIPYVERLDQHGKFREPDVKQEMDNKYELLPYFENPQWLAPGNWCSTTNP